MLYFANYICIQCSDDGPCSSGQTLHGRPLSHSFPGQGSMVQFCNLLSLPVTRDQGRSAVDVKRVPANKTPLKSFTQEMLERPVSRTWEASIDKLLPAAIETLEGIQMMVGKKSRLWIGGER